MYRILSVFILCSFFTPVLTAQEAKPIPQGDKAIYSQLSRISYDYVRKEFEKEFNAHCKESPVIKKDFTELFYENLRTETLLAPFLSAKKIREKAFAFSQKHKNIKDLLILSEIAQMLYEYRHVTPAFRKQSTQLATTAETILPTSTYGPFFKYRAIMWQYLVLRTVNTINHPHKDPLADRYFDALYKWTVSFKPSSEEERYLFLNYSERIAPTGHQVSRLFFFRRYENFHNQWKKNKGQSSPWLQAVIEGFYHLEKYWFLKKNGDKNNTKENNKKLINESIQNAGISFTKAYQLNPKFPEAAAEMITATMLSSTEQEKRRKWFDRAVAAEVNYTRAYDTFTWSLFPHRGGSHEQMMEFALECLQTKMYNTLIPYQYYHIIKILKKQSGEDYFKKNPQAYTAVHKLLKRYEKMIDKGNYYLSVNPNFIIQQHFSLSYFSKNYRHARQTHARYGDKIRLNNGDIDYQTVIPFIYAVDSLAENMVESIYQKIYHYTRTEKYSDARNLEQTEILIKEIEEAKKLCPAKEADIFFKSARELAQMEKDFHSGKWVNLHFTEDFRQWTNKYRGDFIFIDKTTILGDSQPRQIQYLLSKLFVPPPYEIELSVEGIKSNSKTKRLYTGLASGRLAYGAQGRFFWSDNSSEKMGVRKPYKRINNIKVKIQKTNHLKLKIWPGYYEYLLNDKEIIIKNDKDFQPLLFGCAVAPTLVHAGQVKYSNMRIRKINIPPAPPTKKHKERLSYYETRLLTERNAGYLNMAATACYRLKDYKKAISYFQAAYDEFDDFSVANLLSEAYSYDKQFIKGITILEKTLPHFKGKDYESDRISTLNLLSWKLSTCEQTINTTDALKYAIECNKLSEYKNASCLDTLACAYAANKQFEEALKWIETAITLEKNKNTKKEYLKRKELFLAEVAYIAP